MATQGQFAVISKTKAGEDHSAHQYHAIALDDGERADNSHEAGGIILNKPKDNEHVNYGVVGEFKYRAGVAIGIKNRLRVTTDGWMVLADSGYYTIGSAKEAVTSGSIGTGFFNFATPFYQDVSSL